ncbi:hypothetical protein RA307_06470 [Xanthobacteraceae bacterium Astr-EGSB]|uniref:class I SAM-dependent methyltransferase n=1 Tax=Astrobacterium formosum TaxID=3069710 RepID=UPI0027B7F843|nr:hypothetical protein [Xanthobacteraceae bacterium Astr-EGSB]
MNAIDPLALYAAGIDGADYVDRVTPPILHALSSAGDLLDVGAGGGQLGEAIRTSGHRWTAVEPSPSMRARLAALDDGPDILACGWNEAPIATKSHDTVLAANIAAPFGQASAFLDRCRAWARRTVVWVVPAQHGPRGLVLAGALPAVWHGEDETPGVDSVLAALGAADQPHELTRVDWTFRLTVDDLDRLATYLADRLGWPPDDPRRPEICAHLGRRALHVPGGRRLDVAKASAILVWRQA